jgi:hypothetical protein
MCEGTTNLARTPWASNYLLQDRQWSITFGSKFAILAAKSRPDVDPTARSVSFPIYAFSFDNYFKDSVGMMHAGRGETNAAGAGKFSPTPFPTPKKKEEAVSELLELCRCS